MTTTADNITDDQIRELCGPGCDRSVRRLCKIALNDAATYLRTDVVRNARGRCADLHNARSVPTCPTCNKPTHASESNDDGVCAGCLGSTAIMEAP